MTNGEGIDRRRLGLAAGGLLLASCAGSQRQILVNAATQGAAAAPDPTDAQLETALDASERVTAPVRIDGAGPFNFVVDTGANRTVVSSELAAALKLRDGGPADVHGVAGVESTPTALIDLFQADAVTARGLRAPTLPRDRLGADGLLGVDVLYNRRMLIDFVNHQITITGDHGVSVGDYNSRQASVGIHRNLGLRIAVPARYRFGQLIIIGADVSGHGVTAFVDSGSQSTVGNNALRSVASVSGVSDPKAARQMTPILSATGQTAEGEVIRMPLLRIGGLDITGLTTVFADLHVFQLWDLMKRPSLLLGMDILRRFNAIELNYAQREVAFYLPARGHTN